MRTVVKEYRYRTNIMVMLLAVLFFGVCGGFMLYTGLHNDRGLILNGFIRMDEPQADIFYYVMAALSAAFVLLGILAPVLEKLRGTPAKLTLYSDGISYPFGKDYREFKWYEIKDVKVTDVNGTVIIELFPETGKRHSLVNNNFRSKQEFEEVLAAINSGVKPRQ